MSDSALRDAKAWVRQWENAGRALAEQRRRELAAVSDSQALARSDALLELAATAWVNPARRTYSGLVEQQALFGRLRTR